jgi:hypothetical protein
MYCIMILLLLFFLGLLLVPSTYGALFERFSDLPETDYDFIIVGGTHCYFNRFNL